MSQAESAAYQAYANNYGFTYTCPVEGCKDTRGMSAPQGPINKGMDALVEIVKSPAALAWVVGVNAGNTTKDSHNATSNTSKRTESSTTGDTITETSGDTIRGDSDSGNSDRGDVAVTSGDTVGGDNAGGDIDKSVDTNEESTINTDSHDVEYNNSNNDQSSATTNPVP